MTTIWVVEDDDDLAVPLLATLRSAGHEAHRLGTVAATRAALDGSAPQPDAVLLDLGLPDGDGIGLCRELRLRLPEVVIVVLTARDGESDVVIALDAGADDYLLKPFRLVELLARIRAHLRRVPSQRTEVHSASGVTVDPSARRAVANGRELALRPKEYELLEDLVTHAGQAVRREDLMSRVWDEHWDGSTKTLDMHVSWLRAKLAATGVTDVLTTLRGVGYRFEDRPHG
jgi:DNA-binding response OmpR family regulator